MKKISLIALPIILIVSLTGCEDKTGEIPVPPSPVPAVTESAPEITAAPKPTSSSVSSNTGLENTDAAALGETIQDYKSDVNASNDKAREIIDAYNERIESATGK